MRDYSSISPSAKSLLLMKGLTDIPFIAEAAKLVWGNEAVKNLPKLLETENFLKIKSKILAGLKKHVFQLGSFKIKGLKND